MPKPLTVQTADRNADLAQIHIAQKQLAMADDAYRDLLWAIGRVRSAGDLDHAGRRRLIEHFRKCGFKSTFKRPRPATGWEWVNNAAGYRQPLLRKIAVMLRDSDREKAYADGIAKKMFGIHVVEFCAPDQLHKIVSALEYDRRRRAAASQREPS